MICLQAFLSFVQIGLFSFGGGYASLPLIYEQLVNTRGWLNMTEFTDILTISQMTPGPIAINAATFAGIRIGGLPAALSSTIGCILPSTIIAIILAKIYYKYRSMSVMKGIMNGLRPAVAAMIGAAGLSIAVQAFWADGVVSFAPDKIDFIALIIFTVSLVVLRVFKPNQIAVLIGAGIVGAAAYLLI